MSSRSTQQGQESSSKFDKAIFRKSLSKEMSVESLMFFVPSTTKWRPSKIIAKLNGNHLLLFLISDI